MNLEALGRTYHGGAPVPLQLGDLVTAADAPDGAPTWVGAVELATNHVPPLYRVNQMGNGSFFMNPWEIRPLTDAEAVGLAEMLSGGRWEPLAGESWSLLGSGDDDAVVMLAAPHQWRCLPAGSVEFVGRCHNIDHGKALASRALILYTIRGQP